MPRILKQQFDSLILVEIWPNDKKKKVVISFDTSWDGERRKTRDEPE